MDPVGRLARPDVGVVLGTGFGALAEAWRAGPAVGFGGRTELLAADVAGGRVWVVRGRRHLYEGYAAAEVAGPIEALADAGARAVLLTCAAGGLGERDRPGDFAIVEDHVNLTGTDPLRARSAEDGPPAFLDLHGAYDPELRDTWRAAARDAGIAPRSGILAAVPGPCYETPAEVRMLRAIGADLVSMSVVPETIAARARGLRVAAIACVANRGAGMTRGIALRHDAVLRAVERAVARATPWLTAGLEAMVASARGGIFSGR